MSDIQNDAHYALIEDYYADKKAKRSQVPHMNHIDEGLVILSEIGASFTAKQAYCIHPMLQEDAELVKNYPRLWNWADPKVIIAAMEYRDVANEYLSFRVIEDVSEIRLSILKDVNDMLIADKVQNYKDFELHHQGKHPRSLALAFYFDMWLERLGISTERYAELKALIS